MKKLRLSDAAKEDLASIARYTEQRWGEEQKRRYLASLRAAFGRLRERPSEGRPRDVLKHGLRSVHVGRHVLFYEEVGGIVMVLRVLHERMDMARHLKDHD